MNGKMPMFAKVSLISFAYNVIYTFAFPNEHVKNTFAKNDIDFLFSYVKFSQFDYWSAMERVIF